MDNDPLNSSKTSNAFYSEFRRACGAGKRCHFASIVGVNIRLFFLCAGLLIERSTTM
jgi:hypothetical protein